MKESWKDPEFCLDKIISNYNNFQYIKSPNEEHIIEYILRAPNHTIRIIKKLLTCDMCWKIIQRNPSKIVVVPEKYRTVSLWKTVLKKDSYRFSCLQSQTQELVDIAFETACRQKNHRILTEIRPEFLTQEMIEKMIDTMNQQCYLCYNIPKMNIDIAMQMIRLTPKAITRIPNRPEFASVFLAYRLLYG